MMEATQDFRRFAEAAHLRLNQVEQENRRLRRIVLVLGLGVAGAVGLTAALFQQTTRSGQSNVQAKEYVLVGEDGVARGAWRLLDDGSSTFALHDQNGLGRIRFSVLSDGAPGVSFTDARGKSRLVISLLPDMTGTVVFADESGTTRTVLGLAADGSSTLVFADAAGSARASIGIEPDGAPDFTMIDSERSRSDADSTTGSRSN